MFVDDTKLLRVTENSTNLVPASDTASVDTDCIYIKPRMNFGTKQRVMAAGVKLSQQAGLDMGGGVGMTVDVGSYQIAQLLHNIVRWAGPSFAGVDLTEANILRLDPEEPLVKRVLQEIARGNRTKESPDPKSLTMPATSKNTGG